MSDVCFAQQWDDVHCTAYFRLLKTSEWLTCLKERWIRYKICFYSRDFHWCRILCSLFSSGTVVSMETFKWKWRRHIFCCKRFLWNQNSNHPDGWTSRRVIKTIKFHVFCPELHIYNQANVSAVFWNNSSKRKGEHSTILNLMFFYSNQSIIFVCAIQSFLNSGDS